MTLIPSASLIAAQRYGALAIWARFTVLVAGIPQGTPYLAALSDGSVTIDRNSEFRRSGSLTLEVIPSVPPPILMPVDPSSLLAPFGNEIFLELGVGSSGDVISGNTIQWVPLGVFPVTTSTVDDTGTDLTITLELNDRAWVIAQRTLKNPYNFPATEGGNFVEEMIALINMVWDQQIDAPPLAFNIVPTLAIVPTASYDQGSDPWQATQDMASAVGYELYFDENGVVVGHPVPDPTSQPVLWNFTDDTVMVQGVAGFSPGSLPGAAPYSAPIEVQVTMTRDGVYNDIVVQGTGYSNMATYSGDGLETSSPPILAEAEDSNPSSPTYVGGAMGDVPDFISSALVTAYGAQPMANNQLQVALSSAWQVTITAAENPIYDVDNVVTVTRPRLGLNNALVVLDTVTHAVSWNDLMQLTGRVITNQIPNSP